MEFVDPRHQQGFWLPRRPVHGIQGDATIDPGAVIAGEQEVWQWRQHEAVMTEMVAKQANRIKRQIGYFKASNKKLCQPGPRQFVHPGT